MTSKIWVIKIGSSVLGGSNSINQDLIKNLALCIKEQLNQKQKIILVSSGAISQGMRKLAIKKRPNSIEKLQALAAIGQVSIISAYFNQFSQIDLKLAQILLTAQDLRDRNRYLNAKNTLNSLLNQSIVPIVNENDTISTEAIRFGDNDTLAALVANLVSANYLLILTDIEGLYDKNPKIFQDAKLITNLDANDNFLDSIKGSGAKNEIGSGGMKTKIAALKIAAKSGTSTIIANALQGENIKNILNNPTYCGSFFKASFSAEKGRKLWLGYALKPVGKIIVNQKAALAIEKSSSLLAVGIEKVIGNFSRGDLVIVALDQNKLVVEISRGISNYSSDEINQIKGLSTEQINTNFSFSYSEVIHRDNMLIAQKNKI